MASYLFTCAALGKCLWNCPSGKDCSQKPARKAEAKCPGPAGCPQSFGKTCALDALPERHQNCAHLLVWPGAGKN